MTKIFMSYARADKEKVCLLRDFLTALGYEPWMDIYNLPPGSNFKLEIQREIEHCDYFLACLSNHSVDHRGYVQAELKWALEELDKIPEGKIFIIPVRFDECEVPHSLKPYNWVDEFQPENKLKLAQAFTYPKRADINVIHQKMRKAELFSPKHNEGRIEYRQGNYPNAERLAHDAYDEIPNPHSKLNELVAMYAQGKIIKPELDQWVFKLNLEDSHHGQSVLEKGY